MFFNCPRIEAKKLMICLFKMLNNEEVVWKVSEDFSLLNTVSKISINTKNGRVYLGKNEIWMPLLKRWRLARAAKQKAIDIVLEECFDKFGE
jgi:hypothetical protein